MKISGPLLILCGGFTVTAFCVTIAVSSHLLKVKDDELQRANSKIAEYKKLSTESKALQRRISQMETEAKETLAASKAAVKQYEEITALQQEFEKLKSRQEEAAQPVSSAVQTSTTITPSSTYIPHAQAPAPAPADPLAKIPQQAATIIRQQAALRWPNDLSMQSSVIEREAQAWITMNGYETKTYGTMQFKIQREIAAESKRRWPMDFTMQVSNFEGQTAAYQTAEEWERVGIPGISLRDSKAAVASARKKWGDDHKMVIYEVKKLAGR
jgi:hypothetical protein